MRLSVATRRVSALVLLIGLGLAPVGCVPAHVNRERGFHAMQTGRLDDARREFDAAHRKDPEHWQTQYYLGLLHLREGRSVSAQIALERAYALAPDQEETPEILDKLAEAMLQRGDRQMLAQFLEQTARDRGQPADHLRRGRYLAKIGDVDGAVLAYRTAARLAGRRDPAPYQAMFELFESIGDRDRAATALRHLYWFNPNDPRLADRLRAYGIVPGPTAALPPMAD